MNRANTFTRSNKTLGVNALRDEYDDVITCSLQKHSKKVFRWWLRKEPREKLRELNKSAKRGATNKFAKQDITIKEIM